MCRFLQDVFRRPLTAQERQVEFVVDSLVREYDVVLFTANPGDEYGQVVARVLPRRHYIFNVEGMRDRALIPLMRACLRQRAGYDTLPVLFLHGHVVASIGAIQASS
ncbi:unnamed protein product [Aphanomyces euteiches]|nr:hypothetical protein AeMF1_015857 [Aphanomyces euteiches]KAH9119694.1 hypothetical protein LEN26_011484 [Aphanomyces euteiches]KAH9139841.1 hypothetical protein AeRB84_015909 [Aphanomyces euteiches]KAH9187250.1 hypothetical protein AeNC1_010771 [Aphanomyces euteiches]